MKKLLCIISACMFCVFFTSCRESASIGVIGGADGPTAVLVSDKGGEAMYQQITPAEAKQIMDSEEKYIILDVREQDEFENGHIPGAVLIPYTEIDKKAEELLPDKEIQILVYCRSGRRSKIASESLGKLGYKNVKEFGGITDWPYEVVK